MQSLKERINTFAERLEEDEEYEISEEMEEEFFEIKKELEEEFDNNSLKKLFISVCSRYDTPMNAAEGILNSMFPETNGEFDLD